VAALLAAFLPQYYTERALPDAILLSERPADDDVIEWLEAEGVAVRVPGAGREATLVDLALKNARQGPVQGDPLAALGEALGIDRPRRIEGFDVSHSQGKAVVGSNVCVVDGSAETGDYRRKKLTDRNDDYANMRELIAWRATRAVEGRDDRPDPGLLLVDGGEGQLGAAMDALETAGWDVPAVALAKEEELVITPNRVFDWPSDAEHLHVCQRVRDEATGLPSSITNSFGTTCRPPSMGCRVSAPKPESGCSGGSGASTPCGRPRRPIYRMSTASARKRQQRSPTGCEAVDLQSIHH
jgi:Excinuclease ABC subunit C